MISALGQEVGRGSCDLPIQTVVDHALREPRPRVPFDRLIVANAKAGGVRVITRDEKIHRKDSRVIW